MPRHIYRPASALARYVDLYWSASSPESAISSQRIYPLGAMALVVHQIRPSMSFVLDGSLHEVRSPLLAGPYSRSFDINPLETTPAVGALFRPGAARALFGVAASELHNTDIALRDLDPSGAQWLLDEVCSAVGERARVHALEQYLARRMNQASALHPAIGRAIDSLSSDARVIKIREVQNEVGLSHTRFIQLFREHVGLTPKLYCRLRRFRALLNRLENGGPAPWSTLAADCGYSDQAHLIRDFHAFAGATPLEYLRTKSDLSKAGV